MKLFVDLSWLQHYPGGIPVYVIQLYREILRQAPKLEVSSGINTLFRRNITGLREAVTKHISSNVSYRWHPFPGRVDAREIPLLGRFFTFKAAQFDVLHFPGHAGGAWVPFDRLDNAVLTIHDMFVFHGDKYTAPCSETFRRFALKYVPVQAEQCAHILTVSEFSKREILRFLGDKISADKITVTPNSVQWLPEALLQAPSFPLSSCPELKPHGYFLSVSSLLKHKNYETLLAAWRKYLQGRSNPTEKLVIVGASADMDVCEKVHRTPGVVHLTNVPQAELLSLYRNAIGFFLLSFIEGFGMPLLEAMLCGCPACYAKGSSMDEIGGDDAWPLSPVDVDGVSAMFQRFMEAPAEVAQRALAARTRASEQFSWSKTARLTLDVFEKVASMRE